MPVLRTGAYRPTSSSPYMGITGSSNAEPILPIRRIRKLRRAPETPGDPLALKYDLILVVFFIMPTAMKTWWFIVMQYGRRPFYVTNLSNHVTWMWWSLLLETKTMSWKHSEPRKRHCFVSAIQDREMCFIHNHSNKWTRPAQMDLSVETQKGWVLHISLN